MLKIWGEIEMFRTNKTKSLLATGSMLVLGAVALAATPASAADKPAPAAAQSDGTVSEVVVTAQFRAQNLQRTPLAITAVNAQTLESRGQTSVADVANQAPNVTLKPAPAPFGPSLQAFIRGVGQGDFNFALEPGVGMYVDDVYFSTLTGSIFDLLDLDRVEVLRGPQGTLAGMNSIGGAIKLYTKKPDGQDSGFLEGTYGSYNRTDIRGSADFTVVPGQLFVRLSGVARHQDGYVTRYDYACTHPGAPVPSYSVGSSCKLGTEGGHSYDAIRLETRWTPNDRLEVNLTGDYTNDRSEASPFTLLAVGTGDTPTVSCPTPTTCVAGPIVPGKLGLPPLGPRLASYYPRYASTPGAGTGGGVFLGNATGSPFISYSPLGPYAQDTFSTSPYINYSTYGDAKPIDGTAAFQDPPVNRVSQWGVSGNIDYKLTDDISLKSITAYRAYRGDWSIDEDGSPLSDEVLHDEVWHWQVSEEARISGKAFNDTVNWVLGGFYFDQKSHYGGRIDLGSMEFVEDDYIPATNEAAFANVDWRATDQLEFNFGGRYSHEDKTFMFGRLGVPGNTYPACAAAGGAGVAPAVCSLNGSSGKFTGGHWDYRAAVQYQWTPNFMTYADVSTGFKGGGVNPRPFYLSQEVAFAPETMTAFEGGIKSEWLDHRLRLNLAGFYDRYDSIQLTASNCAFIPGSVAAGQATPCAAILNAGNADVKGLEAEAEAHLFDGFSIDGSISYLSFDYTSLSVYAQGGALPGCAPAGTAACTTAGAGIKPGMKSPFAPTWKYSLGAQYQIPLGKLGYVIPRLDWSYQSSFYGSASNSPWNLVQGYGLLNGRLTYKNPDGKWSAALEVSNITGKVYYLGVFDNRGSDNNVMAEPAAPREWAVTLKRVF